MLSTLNYPSPKKKILKKFRNFVINGKNNEMSEKNKKHHDENSNCNNDQVQVDPRPQKTLVKLGSERIPN